MFNRNANQKVGDRGTAGYTTVPTGPPGVVGDGGTANYPAGQKVTKMGYGYDAGKGVNSNVNSTAGSYPSGQKVSSQKTGYGGSNVYPQQNNGYVVGPNGGPYVQQTPVAYGPDGTPYPVVRKKSHTMRNIALAALAACCCCIAL